MASGVAITMSQNNAIEHPSPTAGPLTLAMIGVSMLGHRVLDATVTDDPRADAAGSTFSSRSQSRSPPAENARPLPVRTASLMSWSRSMSTNKVSLAVHGSVDRVEVLGSIEGGGEDGSVTRQLDRFIPVEVHHSDQPPSVRQREVAVAGTPSSAACSTEPDSEGCELGVSLRSSSGSGGARPGSIAIRIGPLPTAMGVAGTGRARS